VDCGHRSNTSRCLAKGASLFSVTSVQSLRVTRTTMYLVIGVHCRFLHISHVHQSCKHRLMCVS
jgi:hypothetical protein